jgi:hypothetical protein
MPFKGPTLLALAAFVSGCEETYKINVPSDPDAIYLDYGTVKQDNGFVQVWSHRSSSSGLSNAVRVVDCNLKTFEYIHDADEGPEEFPIENAVQPSASLVDGSISYWVSGYACRKHGYSVADW